MLCKRLRSFNLSRNNINDKGAIAIANKLITKSSRLQQLNLSFNPIGLGAVDDEISRLLCDTSSVNNTYHSNHSLKQLELSDNDFKQLELSDSIQHAHLGYLLLLNRSTNKRHIAIKKILNFHHNMDMSPLFKVDGKEEDNLIALPYVIDWFERAMRLIIREDIIYSEIELETQKLSAIYQFTRAVPLSVAPIPLRVEHNDPTLTKIMIGGGNAYTRYAHASSFRNDYDELGTSIGGNTHLTKLYYNSFVPGYVTALDVSNRGFFEGLKQNTSISNLLLDGRNRNRRSPLVGGNIHAILNAYQRNNNKLSLLRINHVGLRNGGEQILATTFKRCTNLKTIVLGGCGITNEQLLPIVDALRGHPLEALHLQQNHIRSMGCEALSSLLADQHSNLLLLNLLSNNVDDDGVNILVDSLVDNTKLKHLCLIDNHINPRRTHNVFSNLLINNTSNINSIYASNHTLTNMYLPQNFPQKIKQQIKYLLNMNCLANKSHVAILKILKRHPNIHMEQLFEWDEKGEQTLKSLPYVIDWFERAVKATEEVGKSSKEGYLRKTNNWKLSAIYEYSKAMPLEFVPASHKIKMLDEHDQGKKKRKRDDMQETKGGEYTSLP